MPNVSLKQSNFTAGELSPTLIDRSRLTQYQNGAAKLRNVLCLPHGGVQRRPGLAHQFRVEYQSYIVHNQSGETPPDDTVLSYTTLETGDVHTAADLHIVVLDTSTDVALETFELTTDYTVDTGAKTITLNIAIPNGVVFIISKLASYSLPIGAAGLGNSFGRVQMFEFEFSTEENYLFVHTVFTLNIYRKVSGVYTHQFMVNTPFYQFALQTITQIQQLDSSITMSKFHPPLLTQRTGSHTSWATSDWELKNIPKFEYEDAKSPSTAVNHEERIHFVGFLAGNIYKLFVDGVETEEIEFGRGGSTTNTIADMEAGIEALPDVSVGDVTVTLINGSVEYLIVMAVDSAGKKWDFAPAEAEFSSLTGSTPNEIRFSTKVEGHGDEEDVWSSVRGWPLAGSFFQSRLWFSGSFSRPQTVWSSRSLNLNDFNSTRTLADYGINYTVNTDKVSAFFALQAGRHLQFFSSSAEFYVPTSAGEVVTPESFVIRRTSQRGTREGSRVFDIDGGSFFVQRHGKSVQEFLFSEDIQAYVPTNTSNISSHLLNDPTSMAYRESISSLESDYLYVVNDGDGSLAVLNTLRSESVNAWSLVTTRGLFRGTAVVDTDSLFAVERTIDSGAGATQQVFVEMFDSSLTVDSGSSGLADSSTNDLNHLGGQTVAIVQDGNVQAQQILASTTTPLLTFVRASATDWQAGIPFPDVSEQGLGWETWVETLPFEPDPGGQSIRGNESSIQKVVLELFETSHVEVGVSGFDQFPVVLQNLGSTLLDTSIPVFTGVEEVSGLQNYSEQSKISITQTQPLPMTLLGVTLKGTF